MFVKELQMQELSNPQTNRDIFAQLNKHFDKIQSQKSCSQKNGFSENFQPFEKNFFSQNIFGPSQYGITNFDHEHPTTIEEAIMSGQKGPMCTLWNKGIYYEVVVKNKEITIPGLSFTKYEIQVKQGKREIKNQIKMKVSFDFYNMCLNFDSFSIKSTRNIRAISENLTYSFQKVVLIVGGNFIFETGKKILEFEPDVPAPGYSQTKKVQSPIRVKKSCMSM